MRISADTALAPIGAQSRVEGIVGDHAAAAPAVLGMDPVRGWALVRVPASTEPVSQLRPISSLPTPIYVVVAEGTQAGATLRPVFLGQGTRFDSVKWSRPLLPLGGIAISSGALLFTLDGEFIGAAVVDGGAPAVVGARDLFDAAERLTANAEGTVGDLGVVVQRLTAELALATRVDRGIVVADVDADGPASTVLAPGDVLTMLAGQPVTDPGEFFLQVAQRRVDENVEVSFVRSGTAAKAMLTVRAASPVAETEAMSLVREPGLGTRVERGGRERVPGLQPGDIVTRAAATAAPTPAQLRALLAQASTSEFLTMVVRRDGRQRVVAARVPVGSNATTR
jgi:S1-C subfamily serine protease